MIDVKLLLAKILTLLYRLTRDRLYVEEYTILDGSTTIDKGSYEEGTLDISKPGYYPVAITGYNSTLSRIAPFRLQLREIASGSAQIAWGIANVGGVKKSTIFTVNVLWEKI